MKEEYTTQDENETFNLGQAIGKKLTKGTIIALIGELGSGKTILTKGIAHSRGIDPDEVTSPTFNLLESYNGDIPFHHFDLYRIESDSEFDNLFFEEYWNSDGISVIEWADRAAGRLPRHTITIHIEYNNPGRMITIEYPGN